MTNSISPAHTPLEWQHGRFLISTSQSLLQPEAVNDAFDSDFMYWTQRQPSESMEMMLRHSMCFGLYEVVDGTEAENLLDASTRPPLRQIGLGRVVTDYTTFAYLTDMYILPSHHGTGLGRRLIECIHETLESWPGCRRLMFISNQEGRKFYDKVLNGLGPFEQGKNGYMVMSRSYAGALGNLR